MADKKWIQWLKDIFDRIGAPTGASIAADIATARADITAVKAVTDVIPDAGALTTINAAIAAIQAVTDQLPDAGALTTINAAIAAIQAVTDQLPDGGALTTINAAVAAIQTVTDNLPDAGALTAIGTAIDAIKNVTDALPDAGALTGIAADAAAAAAAALNAAIDAAIAAGHADPDPAGTAAALIGALNNLAAGAQMDLVDAPNATAIAAIQLGLAKTAELISGAAVDFGAVAKASIQAAAQAAITASSLALASNCDAKSSDIKAKTDKITLPVYRQIFKSADSAMLASLAFSNVAADKDFPSVVTTAKPTGATITKAYWGFVYSKKVDSSAGANAVSAANKTVRVKVSTGAWGTDDIVAYTFANGALSTPASATEGGMMIMGSVDIKSVVDGSAATFNFRSEETERSDALTVTAASLTFYDVESWLVVEYTL